MDGWNTSFLLGWPIFRCYVSFGEGISVQNDSPNPGTPSETSETSAPPPVAIPLHTLSRPTKTANGGSMLGVQTVTGWGFLCKGAPFIGFPYIHWLVVSTHFEKYMSQLGNLYQIGVKIKISKTTTWYFYLYVHYSSTIYLPLPVHNFPPKKKQNLFHLVLTIYNGVFTPMGTE